MATKAQKRARGEARAKIALEESIASGLRAQAADRKRREEREREALIQAQEINRRHQRILAAALIAGS